MIRFPLGLLAELFHRSVVSLSMLRETYRSNVGITSAALRSKRNFLLFMDDGQFLVKLTHKFCRRPKIKGLAEFLPGVLQVLFPW